MTEVIGSNIFEIKISIYSSIQHSRDIRIYSISTNFVSRGWTYTGCTTLTFMYLSTILYLHSILDISRFQPDVTRWKKMMIPNTILIVAN